MSSNSRSQSLHATRSRGLRQVSSNVHDPIPGGDTSVVLPRPLSPPTRGTGTLMTQPPTGVGAQSQGSSLGDDHNIFARLGDVNHVTQIAQIPQNDVNRVNQLEVAQNVVGSEIPQQLSSPLVRGMSASNRATQDGMTPNEAEAVLLRSEHAHILQQPSSATSATERCYVGLGPGGTASNSRPPAAARSSEHCIHSVADGAPGESG